MRYDRGSQNQDLHGRLRAIAAGCLHDAARTRAAPSYALPAAPSYRGCDAGAVGRVRLAEAAADVAVSSADRTLWKPRGG